jgi:tetratricopeptide (TPR) repeat protein
LAEYDAWLSGARTTDDKANGLNDKCWVRAEWNHELDKALEDCKAALRLKPYWRSLLYTRGFLYLRMKRYDDAVRDLNQIIAAQPRLAFAIYCRGLAKTGAGKAADGQADIKAATAIDPKIEVEMRKYGLIPDAPAKP